MSSVMSDNEDKSLVVLVLFLAIVALMVSMVVRTYTRKASPAVEKVSVFVNPPARSVQVPHVTSAHARDMLSGSVMQISDYDPYTERGIGIVDGVVATIVPTGDSGMLKLVDVASHHKPEGEVLDVGILPTGHYSRAFVRTTTALYCYYSGDYADGENAEDDVDGDRYRWHRMYKVNRATHAATITRTYSGRVLLVFDQSYVDVTDRDKVGAIKAIHGELDSEDERSNDSSRFMASDGQYGYLSISSPSTLASTGGTLYKWSERDEEFVQVYTTSGTELGWTSSVVFSSGVVVCARDRVTDDTTHHELLVRGRDGTVTTILSRSLRHDTKICACRPNGEYLLAGRGKGALVWTRAEKNGGYMDNPVHLLFNGSDASKARINTYVEDGKIMQTIVMVGEHVYELE